MRLKEISLQGYKSFATKHRFAFPSVVTAVVGPNGSGKSNIADAMRWVLGEQRSSFLRAKKTDDLIFAGTERRPRAGLAEVTLTLDNSESWLDIDFPEVAITRRAHRDGSNEYFLNGARVRLRDILDLIEGRLGRSTYTVIGQGLVDSALALRPEERRGLIDEAAGVVPLQRKRDAALRRLAETDENLTRVSDILAELGPRLRRIQRLGKRAERHAKLTDEIEGLLGTWYRYHVYTKRKAQTEARRQAEERRLAVEAARQHSDELRDSYGAAQLELEEAEGLLGRKRAERERAGTAVAEAQRAVAVATTRLDGVRQRLEETRSHIAELEEERSRLRNRRQEFERALEGARTELENAKTESSELADDDRTSAREALLEAAESARAEVFEASAQTAAARNRTSEHADRSRRLTAERESVANQLSEMQDSLAEAKRSSSELETRCSAADTATRQAVEALEAEQDRLNEVRLAAAQAQERHARAAARLEEHLGAADHVTTAELGTIAAAQEQLAAAGIETSGCVRDCLEVQPGWELAVAVALGDLALGLVVTDPEALEKATDVLEPGSHGRLPLVVATPVGGRVAWEGAAGERTYRDVASTPDQPGLAGNLLSSVAFVDNVVAALRSVTRSGGPARAATRDGFLAIAGGVIVVGGPPSGDQAEATHQRLVAEEERLAALVGDEELKRQAAREKLAELEVKAAELASERDGLRAQLAASRMEIQRAERETEWAEASLSRLDDDIAAVGRAAAEAAATLEAAEERERQAQTALEERLAAADAAGPPRIAVTAAAARVADAAQRVAVGEARLEAAAAEFDDLERRIASRVGRLETYESDAQALETELEALEEEARQRQDQLSGLDKELEPLSESVREARSALRERADELDRVRREASRTEEDLTDARLAAARAEDATERLFDQLRADADWLPAAANVAAQLASVDPDRTDVAAPEELPEDLEEKLTAARQRLRRIGAIDHEALEEQKQVAERHAHLTEQKEDLQSAMRDLQVALSTLESEMSSRFDEAFESVGAAFSDMFPRLFGGGEARLVTEKGDDGAIGVDIVACPPGKREQPLALLSGGERAITAVALIFALLKASGTPFVVLDEVDAALDEANIDRFGQTLASLAESTQVVIITHNRGTIQRAGTVYGVTMGDDGASQVISLDVESAV